MTGAFILAAGIFILSLVCLGAFVAGLFEDEPGQVVTGFLLAAILMPTSIAIFHNAVYVETTCSAQGLHTVGGTCVELIEVE